MKRIVVIVIVFILLDLYAFAGSKKTGNDFVTVKVIPSYSQTTVRSEFFLIFKFKLEKQWHIYWKNPGDAGLPTQIDLKLPAGFKAEEIMWQPPIKFPFDDLVNFGYKDSVELMIPVMADSTVQKGTYEIEADVKWLACKEECLSGSQKLKTSIIISDSSVLDENIHTLKIFGVYPYIISDFIGHGSIKGDTLDLMLTLKDNFSDGDNIELFPVDQGIYIYSSITTPTFADKSARFRILLDPYRESNPDVFKALCIIKKKDRAAHSGAFYLATRISH